MDEPSAQTHDEPTTILRDALPEAWRHAAEATLTPEGFTFQFRDAEGRRHSLDARPRDLVATALVTGDVLGYSYTIVDPTVDDAAVLEQYRDVLTALAAREADLLPWLPAPTEAAPVEAPAPWRGPLPGERPAPARLVAILRAELPPAWRHDLSVSLTQNGFVLQFVDEAGARHALDAREIRPESPTLVSGRVLAFSYLFVGGGAEETALAGEYRAVLSRLAARENDLLPWLDPTAPAGGPSVTAPLSAEASEALPDEHPAPASLVSTLRAALPEAWRHAVQASLSPGGFIFRFRDAEGRQHALDARELRLVPSAFVSGGALGYSYTIVDPAVDEASVIDGYRSVLTALAARESDLLPSLALSPAEAEGRPNAVASEPSWKGPFPNEKPAPSELEALARGALPEAWRHDVAVSLTPGGFIVRFRDAEGRRHAFDAREARSGEPTLVSGRSLAFSYLCLEEGAEETALAGEYRAALAALAARESDLLPWLSLSPVEAEGADTAVAATPSWKGPFPNEQPAPPELDAVVRGALPEAWRHDLALSLTPGGFIVRFRDAGGTRYALDARQIRPDEPTLVSGRVLAFSYLQLEEGVEETAVVGEYRAALAALAAREADLLPWIDRDAPTDAPWLPGAQPASWELAAIVTSLLPAGWRSEVEVLTLPEPAFWVRGRMHDFVSVHAFEARPLAQMAAPLVTGARLGYGPWPTDPPLDEATLAIYRQTLAAFAAREADLLAKIPGGEAPARDDASKRPTSWGQGPDEFPDRSPASADFAAQVIGLLPSTWRGGAVTTMFPGGFTVEFKDAAHTRHKLEARLLEGGFPALMRGRRLGFSYLKVDANLNEDVMVPKYREALKGFVEHEDALASALHSAP